MTGHRGGEAAPPPAPAGAAVGGRRAGPGGTGPGAPAVAPPAGEGWTLTAVTATAEATRDLAAALAPLCRPGDVLLLVGGLGAGKTTFAQGFARGLGVAGPVTSPTFTLVRQYPCRGLVRQLLHADVYRLESLAEVADLGLPELVEDGAVALVEWGDAAAPALGGEPLAVTLSPTGAAEDRTVTVTAPGRRWDDRRAVLAAVLAPFAPPATGAAGGVAGTAETTGRAGPVGTAETGGATGRAGTGGAG